jgi:hypothetical protein
MDHGHPPRKEDKGTEQSTGNKEKKGKAKGSTDKSSVKSQDDLPPIIMVAVKDIGTHPVFESLLRIDDEDQNRLTRKMGEEGFWEGEKLVIGLWPGIEGDKPVVIDGPIRWHAALTNGIEEVPCVLLRFTDIMAALRRAIGVQVERRQNSDSAFYSMAEHFDELMERGRRKKNDETEELLKPFSNFSGRSASARRTAKLIGCHYSKVVKIRVIRRDGTPEMQEAVKNNQMTIHKAWKMIRDMELGEDENKRNAAHTRAVKKVLTEENFERLKELPGDMFENINAAVDLYLRSLHDTERGTGPEE